MSAQRGAPEEERMDPGELQTTREALGLTTEALAGMLGVRDDTYRRWESGREPIPYRVSEEVEVVEEYTARAVDEIVATLEDARDPAVVVYRTDAQMHAARPDTAHLPARWWRHVVYRAAERVPGVAIVNAPRDLDVVIAEGREMLAEEFPSFEDFRREHDDDRP